MRNRHLRTAGAWALCALCVVAVPAFGANKTWTGAGADASWSTAANWSPSGAPVGGDALIFPNGAARLINNNDLAAGTSFQSLVFTSPNPGYMLNGNAIQLVIGIVATNAGAANAVYLPITLAATQTWAITDDRVQVWAPVNLNAHTLGISTSAPSGVLELRGGITGSGTLDYQGGGFLYVSDNAGTFTGATTFNGGGGTFGVSGVDLGPSAVTVSTGTLQLVNNAVVGATTFNGGTLFLGGGGTNQHASVNGLTISFPSTLLLEMNSPSDYAQLTVPGPLQLNNPTLSLNWGFSTNAGDSFVIVNPMTLAGTFNGLPEGAFFTGSNGRRYRITYVGGGSGHQVILTDSPLPPAPVPANDPLSLVALALLLAAAGRYGMRRGRRRA